MARSALAMVPVLLLALLASSAYAQQDPSTCDASNDVFNPDVDVTSLLEAYQSLATYGEDYGLNSTCLANVLTNLGSCQEDLTKTAGCCSQSCYDALRAPELANGCLTSAINATCSMAAANIDGARNLTDAMFNTYYICVSNTSRLTCADFNAPTTLPPAPALPIYGGCIPLYGGIGAGFYPPGYGNYPPVYGVGASPAYGVGYGSYGAPIYGVGYPPYYGGMYPPVYGVYSDTLGCVPVYIGGSYPTMQNEQTPSPSTGGRRMARRKATALASELRALRRFHH